MSYRTQFVSGVAALAFLVPTLTVSLPSDGWAQVGEIIVTTRKREENLQDVPISVNVFELAALNRQGVEGLEDALSVSSSFIYTEGFAQKDVIVSVRGFSPSRGRSNVAFLVDGIDVTSEAFNSSGASILVSQRLLSDVQRVELVKGPQSALYGRAAFAGAVQYVTREASDEFEADLRFEAAQHHEFEVGGSVSGPVIDDVLGLRASAYYWDERGQYENEVTDNFVGGGMGYGGALTANLNVGESFRLKARIEYSDDEYEPRPTVEISNDLTLTAPAGAVAAGVLTAGDTQDFLSTFGKAEGITGVRLSDNHQDPGNDYPGNEIEIFRASLIADWDVPGGTLTSYSAFLNADSVEFFDQDSFAVPGPGGRDIARGGDFTYNIENVKIYSQELRYASRWEDLPFFEDRLQMTFGGNYWRQDKDIDIRGQFVNCYDFGVPIPDFLSSSVKGAFRHPNCQDLDADDDPAAGPIDTYQEVFLFNEELGLPLGLPTSEVTSRHMSLYALLELQLTEQFKLTGEARYSNERFFIDRIESNACSFIHFTGVPHPIFGEATPPTCITPPLVSGTEFSDFFAPKGVVEWTPDDNVLLYFSYAQGVKPAGIDQLPPSGGNFVIDDMRFGSERLKAFELGVKSDWEGRFGSLTLNAAGFFQDFTDKQVNVQRADPNGNLTRLTVNAASAEVWGGEIDFNWAAPVDGLTLGGSYTYLHTAKYKDFTDITESIYSITGAGNCTPEIVQGIFGPERQCKISYTGNRLEQAPKHAFALQANLTRPATPLNDWLGVQVDWFIEGDAQYQGKRYSGAGNLTSFKAYHQLDLRAGLQGEQWELLVFVDNVTKNSAFRSGVGGAPDFTRTALIAPFGGYCDTGCFGPALTGLLFHSFAILPPKRTVGVRGKMNF